MEIFFFCLKKENKVFRINTQAQIFTFDCWFQVSYLSIQYRSDLLGVLNSYPIKIDYFCSDCMSFFFFYFFLNPYLIILMYFLLRGKEIKCWDVFLKSVSFFTCYSYCFPLNNIKLSPYSILDAGNNQNETESKK